MKILQYIHIIEYYAAVERNVDHLSVMLVNDLQDKLLHKKRLNKVYILGCDLSKKLEGDMNEYLLLKTIER